MAKPIDQRANLYSLGIVFYEMLTGELPYDAEDMVSLAMQHCVAPIPVLSGGLVRYQPILDKLLAKRPEDRYDNASQVIEALDQLTADQGRQSIDEDGSTRIRARQSAAARPTADREADRPAPQTKHARTRQGIVVRARPHRRNRQWRLVVVRNNPP